MLVDRPLFRLGVAGFSAAQQPQVLQAVRETGCPGCDWQLGAFAQADAWWIEGSRTELLPGGILRIAGADANQRPTLLALADIDRPLAVSLPVAAQGYAPVFWFRLDDRASMTQVLHKFAAWLQPAVAQYALASSIVDEQPPLGSGAWEVLLHSALIAVVNLRHGTAVAPGVGAEHFREATWCIRDHQDAPLPQDFVRASLSELMWSYAVRTRRDLLPAHYRSRPLYFRRPPKLTPGRIGDVHLLLLRELATQPGSTFDALAQRTGFESHVLAQHLASLYLVGSITANPRRACLGHAAMAGDDGTPQSVAPSGLDSETESPSRRLPSDATVPAALIRD